MRDQVRDPRHRRTRYPDCVGFLAPSRFWRAAIAVMMVLIATVVLVYFVFIGLAILTILWLACIVIELATED